jgi:DNA-binding phage protein
MTMSRHSVFWDDLAEDLKDPEFLREYVIESVRVATIDRLINELDKARELAGLSKTELARAIRAQPAGLRRLFSAERVNPTIGTVAEAAAALGLRLELVPLSDQEREQITVPLRTGRTRDPHGLTQRLGAMRRHRQRRVAST